MVYSSDRGATVHQSRPRNAGANGTAVAIDHVTGVVYLSVGQQTGTDRAELFSSPDPAVPALWTSERLGQAPGERGRRADGLAIGHSARPIIVAGVVASGIWRKVVTNGPGSGTWQQVLVHPDFGIELRASWVPDQPIVYVYDHMATGGLWMSTNGGRTWGSNPIWTQPSPVGMTGFIAADPTDPTRVYVSTSSGLFVVTDTTGTPTATQLTTLPDPTPGPVAVQNDGVVWVTGKAGDAIGTDLYRSLDGGDSWEEVGDDFYRNAAPFPHGMAVAADGFLYFVMRGTAMIAQPPVP